MKELLKDRKSIIAWLEKQKVKNYTLTPNDEYGFLVSVAGNVYLYRKNLDYLPVKFGDVSGDFSCALNKLTSLRGCPQFVGGYFYCDNNQLPNLEDGPISVGWSYWCNNNQLKALDYYPASLGGEFHCDNNPQLGKYQNITDFIELKDKLISDREKASLSASLALPVKSILHKV